MFSHITVGSANLDHSGLFYDAVLNVLGLVQRQVAPDGGPRSLCWVANNYQLPRFYVYEPLNREEQAPGNGTMTAFLARTSEDVDQAYAAGIAAGGCDEGEPGERLHYGAGYYGAYLRDPSGNKIHIVCRGDLTD